jgi:hypothetical protein
VSVGSGAAAAWSQEAPVRAPSDRITAMRGWSWWWTKRSTRPNIQTSHNQETVLPFVCRMRATGRRAGSCGGLAQAGGRHTPQRSRSRIAPGQWRDAPHHLRRTAPAGMRPGCAARRAAPPAAIIRGAWRLSYPTPACEAPTAPGGCRPLLRRDDGIPVACQRVSPLWRARVDTIRPAVAKPPAVRGDDRPLGGRRGRVAVGPIPPAPPLSIGGPRRERTGTKRPRATGPRRRSSGRRGAIGGRFWSSPCEDRLHGPPPGRRALGGFLAGGSAVVCYWRPRTGCSAHMGERPRVGRGCSQ